MRRNEMGEIKELQARVWANKVSHGFNTTNVEREFNYTYAELSEAYEAYKKCESTVGEELADVVMFTLSLAQMLKIDLEKELALKAEMNEKRQYKELNGHHVHVKENE
jgi:NTP pyrophosphatase (non-canonical NTP hydrolase)